MFTVCRAGRITRPAFSLEPPLHSRAGCKRLRTHVTAERLRAPLLCVSVIELLTVATGGDTITPPARRPRLMPARDYRKAKRGKEAEPNSCREEASFLSIPIYALR